VYPILIEDYPRLQEICIKIHGVVIAGGRDINPAEYFEPNTKSFVSMDSSLRFNLIRAIL
jgi:gamma-glutamyl-gamma-aminobutyrate hydrolase PuuD